MIKVKVFAYKILLVTITTLVMQQSCSAGIYGVLGRILNNRFVRYALYGTVISALGSLGIAKTLKAYNHKALMKQFEMNPDELMEQFKKTTWRLGSNNCFTYIYPGGGYYFTDVTNRKQPQNNIKLPTLASVCNRSKNEIQELSKDLVKQYKIHLMPTQKDLVPVYLKLIDTLGRDKEFSLNITDFKVSAKALQGNKLPNSSDQEIMPTIVIYVTGKDSAQLILNKIYDLFKDQAGLDLTPRFNKQITSLIYYAQGNGDDKKFEDLKEYFEKDMVHYRPNITGEETNYHLVSPAKKH